uniref:LacI family DNA-binding transcriptional regulator n=1 Tax=Streptomyces albidus (ex Kaewkla and Franco 2022) TaxID=722709 RepID=UPI0015EE74D4
ARLGYIADPVAVRLAGRHNRLLGVYTAGSAFPVDTRNSYYPFLAGFEERAVERGYDLILFAATSGSAPAGGPHEGPRTESTLHRVRLADGCVLFGRHAPIPVIEQLLDAGFPLVYIGRRDELGERIPYIGADYVDGARQVVRRLTDLGHRRLLYLRDAGEAPATADRAAGVRAGVEEAALPVELEILVGDESPPGADRIAALVREGVTAFVVENRELYAALTTALEAAGLRVPRDVSVAVLGDDVAAPETVVSGFALPRPEMGRQAADLLIALLEGVPPEGGTQRLLPCVAVEGRTVGPPPGGASR